MNAISARIFDLLPEDVYFAPLNHVFEIRNGYTPAKADSSFWNGGDVPWFRMEDIRAHGRVLRTALQNIPLNAVKGGRLFPANSILISTSATIGEHALIEVPHLSNQRFSSLVVRDKFKESLNPKFAFYYCYKLSQWCKENTTISSFAAVEMDGFRKFPFPIPPMDVQNEIVRILDLFTALENELEAELEARQRQYAYYSEELLAKHSGDYSTFRVSQICKISRGRVISKDYLRANPGDYPVYSSQTLNNGIFGLINTYDYDQESITWTTDGANAGSIFYHIDEQFSLTNVCGLLEPLDAGTVSMKYLAHLLRRVAPSHVKGGMGNPKLMANVMANIELPLPDLGTQTKIAAVLDDFERLVKDIKIGLPAELKARHKQYEYYRDQLLTFKEA